MDDGSEVAVPSLEALARRIDRGEILPHTELFDAGMNAWAPARESAVVRFILEERERDGHDPLPLWEGAFDEVDEDAGDPAGVAEEEAEEAAAAEESAVEPEDGPEDEAEDGDPFDLGLTLEPKTFDVDDAEEEEAGAEEAAEAEADTDRGEVEEEGGPGASEFERFTLGDDFGAGDGEEEDDDEEEVAGAATHDDPLPTLPPLEFPESDPEPGEGEEEDPGPQGGTALEEWSGGPAAPTRPRDEPTGPPADGPPPPRPTSPAVRGREGRESRAAKPRARAKPERKAAAPAETGGGIGRWIGVAAVLAILAVGGYFVFVDRTDPVGDGGPGTSTAGTTEGTGGQGDQTLVGENLGGHASVPEVPADLSVAVERGLAAARARFNAVVDSLRGAHGLPPSPPREWLSGYYLAHASEYPGVREFWEGYAALLGDLRGRDRELFLGAAVGAASRADPARADAAERYLEERYARILPLRRERYQQLTVVSRRARELHDFLVANEERIRYTPATGPEVPLDPIMEANVDSPEVEAELLRELDELFQALNRSRGGGAPGLGGLGNDLFRRFGEG